MSKKTRIIEDARGFIEMYQKGYLIGYMKGTKTRKKQWTVWKEIQEECRLDFEKAFSQIFSKKEVSKK